MRYRLRTLMIVLALGPPVLAWRAWPAMRNYVYPPKQITPAAAGILYSFPFQRGVPEPDLDFSSAD